MVVLLEVAASLMMLRSVRAAIDWSLLKALALGAVPGTLLGVWLLAETPDIWLKGAIAVYLLVISVLSLLQFQFKPLSSHNASAGRSKYRLFSTGCLAGIFNGIAAMGGIWVALFLAGSGVRMATLRATLVLYLMLGELSFFVGAYLNDLFHVGIFSTALVVVLAMWLGIAAGSKLFTKLPETVLKKLVLLALVLIALLGITQQLRLILM